MIIWINGTYGVGKTSVANILHHIFKEKSIVLESDLYFSEYLKVNLFKGGGVYPQTNIKFMEFFREIINRYNKEKEIVIVPMAACTIEAKNILIDYYRKQEFIHVVLTANETSLNKRIINDENRDKELALRKSKKNNKFLVDYYPKNEFIDTSGLTEMNVVEIIVKNNDKLEELLKNKE